MQDVQSHEPNGVGDAASHAPPPLERILEALLFVGGPPLSLAHAQDVIRGLTADQFRAVIDQLNRDYRRQGRPYAVAARESGFVLTLRPRYEHIAVKLYGGVREARLSAAAIDVLAIVAYRQPVARAEVDSLRGAESGALLRQLVRRGLVALSQDNSKREVFFGTTGRFLELFGLGTLDDLPRTQDLRVL